MESRQLRYFSAIAEAGSFTAAARRLNVAQSALSRQISALERDIGAKLFAREPGGVSLTESGHILLRHAEAMRLQAARAREEINAAVGEVRGWFNIGTTPSLGRLLCGRVAARMSDPFPELRLGFVEGVGGNLLTGLADETIDLAITSRPSYAPGISFRMLFSEPVYLVTAPGRDVPASVTNWDDLQGLPLVVTNQQTTMASWVEELSGLARNALDLRYRVESAHAALDIVRRDLACGVLPKSALEDSAFEGKVQATRLPGIALDRHLGWLSGRETGHAFNTLCEIVVQEVGALFSDTSPAPA
jgi:LysR family nitrogen assimilation transcriptional regulator